MIQKIEALDGVIGVIIGHSYGGKSLGKQSRTGSVKVQRIEQAGIKAATQSAKGLQELFIRTESGKEAIIAEKIAAIS
jgi:2-keto-3-deoxy-L-rhamnonate aldolase RhmA